MSTANINVRTDAALKAQARQIFESIGLDLSAAVNLFLQQTVKVNNLPFAADAPIERATKNVTAKREAQYGVWKGKYFLPEDFDAPLNDFEEYM